MGEVDRHILARDRAGVKADKIKGRAARPEREKGVRRGQ